MEWNCPTPLTITHVVRTRSGENAQGQPKYSETSTIRDVYGWSPTSETERAQAALAERVIGELTLLTPDGDYASGDAVIVDGAQYEVIGDPSNFNTGPYGLKPGYTVNLKRVTNG